MLKPTQVSSDSSLDSTLTHASSIEYSNISADNQRRSADNACNNAGEDPTPVPSFPASLASSQSLLSLSDPLNCFIADLPLDMFQPVPLSTYNMSSAQTQQPSPMQSQQQVVSGNISTNFALTRNLEQRNQPLGTGGTAPLTIVESSKPNPISDEAVAQIVSNSSVPEFLYQLTKMLTDDHRDIIEWSNAKIEVHNPHRLESEVLNKYFRHSKYASFQRQLNYFGFRKLAGKGKMAPCSYVNENATNDLRSLLRMKRKTSVNATKETKETKVETSTVKEKKLNLSSNSNTATSTAAAGVKRAREPNSNSYVSVGPVAKIAVGKGVKHRLNGYLRNASQVNPSTTIISSNLTDQTHITSSKEMLTVDPHVIAKAAVGKGISHQFSMHNNSSSSSIFNNRNSANVTRPLNSRGDVARNQATNFTFLDPSQLGMDIESSLSELQNNYQNSLNETTPSTDCADEYSNNDKSGLRRESSLVALAMIPSLGSTEPTSVSEMQDRGDMNNSNNTLEDMDDEKNMMMNFIDFPGEEESIM